MESLLLQKQVRDNAKDLQEYCKDLLEWGNEMKQKDESLKRSSKNQSEEPLPKNKISKVTEENTELIENKPDTKKPKKVKVCDYTAWDKFDAEAYCAKMDKQDAEENSSPESELSDEIDESAIDMANSEKEKGNGFVKKQQWDQAIKCYTKAIEFYAYDPIYYANRALCYLKKENYRNAESDCTTALQLDKTYVKAYQRRAAARENLNQLSEAQSDLLRVLELEKKNTESRNALKRIEKKLEGTKKEKTETIDNIDEPRPVSKFTLSRQKQKNPNIELQAKCNIVKKDVPAIGEHVIERVVPSTSATSNKNQLEICGDSKYTIQSEDKQLKIVSDIASTSDFPRDNLINKHNNDGIQLFESIFKPPKARSKKPLKRIEIIDVDLETEKIYLSNKIKTDVEDREKINLSNKIKTNVEDKEKINLENEKNNDKMPKISETIHCEKNEISNNNDSKSFEELNLPIPKRAVQFYNGWKSISNKEWQRKYLERIDPNYLKEIFKESLESKVFSEIVELLNDSPRNDNISPYDYLVGLSQVKRFSALIMFMSTKDKKNLSDIVEYLKEDNKYTSTDIEHLIELYEL